MSNLSGLPLEWQLDRIAPNFDLYGNLIGGSITDPMNLATLALLNESAVGGPTYLEKSWSATGEQLIFVAPTDCQLLTANLVCQGGAVAASDTTYWTADLLRYRGIETYYNQILASTPGVYYRMNETSGTVATDTAGVINGTYTGGITLNQAGLTGYNVSALFDGTTGYIAIAQNAAFDLGDGPFTIEGWLKYTSTGATQVLLHKGTGAYAPQITSTGVLRLGIGSSGTTVADANVALDANAHYWAMTKNGASVAIYIDGADVTTRSGGNYNPSSVLVNTATGPNIGRSTGGTAFFKGNMDEVAVYKRVLPVAEIIQHYSAGPNPGVIATKTTKVTGGEAIIQRGDWNFDIPALDAGHKYLQKGDAVFMRFTPTGAVANLVNTGCQARFAAV